MSNYSIIDEVLNSWTSSNGYTLQTTLRDEPVRAFEIWSKNQMQKVQVGVSYLDSRYVELTVFDGKRKRKKIRSRVDKFSCLLDEANLLATEWLRVDERVP